MHRVSLDSRSVTHTHTGSDRSNSFLPALLFAASFRSPLLRRAESAAHGGETAFLCHSSGGFPEPRVRWLINNTEEPPEGSVRTVLAPLPDSHLYNVTSHLTVNISKDSSVSCAIENPSMNETVTSTSCE